MCDKAVLENRGTLEPVPDWCKIQQVCDKSALENGVMLESAPDWYKTQQMCDKAVDDYPQNFFLNAISLKRCVIKLLILTIL